MPTNLATTVLIYKSVSKNPKAQEWIDGCVTVPAMFASPHASHALTHIWPVQRHLSWAFHLTYMILTKCYMIQTHAILKYILIPKCSELGKDVLGAGDGDLRWVRLHCDGLHGHPVRHDCIALVYGLAYKFDTV
jgi:hypothetical protein